MEHKIAHLTTVHPRRDVRIFLKECASLAKRPGCHVTLVVADGGGDETADNIRILDVGKPTGRLNRILFAARRVLDRALALDADIYHLHDPELIPVGLNLLRRKKTVIFDAHEDVPKQILNKPYLHPVLARIISKSFACCESSALKRFDGIVAATPGIAEKYRGINNNVVAVNNYPLGSEFENAASCPQPSGEASVCYVGGLSKIRGIREIVQATAYLNNPVRLRLAGRFSEPDFERQVRALPTWNRVEYLGFLNRADVRAALGQARAGLVTLHPAPNYLDALPVKMFEYMAAGIPVIASNFPLWRDLIQGARCGLCVDPLSPEEIARAIDYLHDHPDEARQMGENGRRAVLEKYNWAIEEQKLLAFYQKLLQD